MGARMCYTHGVLFSLKPEGGPDTLNSTGTLSQHTVNGNKQATEGHRLGDSVSVRSPGKSNSQRFQSCQGWEEENWRTASKEFPPRMVEVSGDGQW